MLTTLFKPQCVNSFSAKTIIFQANQVNSCWCPGSLHCQVISSHVIDYKGPCLPWCKVSTTYAISLLRNYKKDTNIFFLFPKTNSAWQGLTPGDSGHYLKSMGARPSPCSMPFGLTRANRDKCVIILEHPWWETNPSRASCIIFFICTT